MSPYWCYANFLLLSLLFASAVGLRFEEPDPRTPRDAGAKGQAEDVRELPDDALQVLPPPSLGQNELSREGARPLWPPLFQPSLPRCRQVAKAWQQCPAWAKRVPHSTDGVASLRGKFLFVDNVKAGSMSVRMKIEEVLGVDWYRSDVPHSPKRDKHHACMNRLSTGSFSTESLAPLFVFGMVRDPVSKFESGVRQAWFQNPALRNMTADELLDMQLGLGDKLTRPASYLCTHNWVNEHLQPSSWRLAAQDMDGRAVQFDCIAQTETFGDDWKVILGSMTNISRGDLGRLLAVRQANVREHDPRSKLSPQAIRRMCQSWVYGHEWDCFGYPRPAVCQ